MPVSDPTDSTPEPQPPPTTASAALTPAWLAAIVESSDDAILSKTLDGTIVSWNSAAERMYGYSAAEMVGGSIYRLVPESLKAEEQEILDRVARGERVEHYETVRHRKDGSLITIALTVSPIRDASGAVIGVSSIKRDITERKRTEEAQRQRAKMEAIGRLAGGLAHDFNNQLHALTGFANFIGRDPGLSVSARHDLIEIQKAAESMASLTRQLLAFARQQTLIPETVDLNVAVAEMRPMLQRLIGASMEMQLALDPAAQWIRIDRSQLAQVVMNLAINARDATPNGGEFLMQTRTLEVGPNQLLDRAEAPVEAGTYVELLVSDSGEGIPPEHLSRIFEPFFTTKDIGQGTGLGLATVENIVMQSAGRIRIESAVGHGTTIGILFPLTAPPEPAAPEPTDDEPHEHPPCRILVVDDEEMVRGIIVRTLRAEGYDVLPAHHGQAALECLDETNGDVDLVITDLVMPVMGGRELIAELLRRYPSLPIIIMSGHAPETGWPELTRSDQPFLQKPVTPGLLLRTVVQMINRAQDCAD